MLLPLTSPLKALRSAALTCLSALLQATPTTTPTNEPFLYLLNSLCDAKLELISDPASLSELFCRLPIQEKPNKVKRRQSRKSVKCDAGALGLGCVEGVLGHVVMFGMPRYVQVVLLQALAGLDHEVSHMIQAVIM